MNDACDFQRNKIEKKFFNSIFTIQNDLCLADWDTEKTIKNQNNEGEWLRLDTKETVG